jgi:hypothetical protein
LVLKPRKNEESQGEPWLREKDLKFRVALVRPWSGPPIPARPTASAAVPLMAERVHTEYGIFRDPAKERKVADYFRCQQEAVADDIILFCRTAKESWGRPLVTGVFYGYFFFLFGRQQTGGHLEIQRVLASPWVDYLSAPQTYAPAFRGMGGSGQSRGLVESFTMHGKLLLDEMDQVPALYGKTGAEAEKALPESVAILRRNVAESYTRGHGMWFYDFGPGLGRKGWWDNAVLMEEIARMRRVFGAYFERPHRPQADVAVVYDTASFYYTASAPAGDPVIDPVALNQLPIRVYQSGAVADVFHLGDLERADWDRYRVVIFANTFLLDVAQKRAIRERVVRGGRHVVWVMAPEYTDGERLDAGFIGDVTGIRVERAETSGGVTMDVRAPGLPAVEISVARGFQPVFVAADASAESLGTLRGGSRVALARKKLDGWTSWFSSLPPANAELLRSIFQLAGVHSTSRRATCSTAAAAYFRTLSHRRDAHTQAAQRQDDRDGAASHLHGAVRQRDRSETDRLTLTGWPFSPAPVRGNASRRRRESAPNRWTILRSAARIPECPCYRAVRSPTPIRCAGYTRSR